MSQRNSMEPAEGKTGGLGFLGYLMIALWFLLTIMASSIVRAEPAAAPITLTASDILPNIEAALAAHGAPADAEIALNDPDQAFVVSGPVEIGHVSYSPGSGRFVMRLANAPVAIAGAAQVSEAVPVLTRAVERGEIIVEDDIAYLEMAVVRGANFVRNADDLIGKEARRRLTAQTPLRASDVAAPVLVRKGALVTLSYVVEGLRLTHQGVAMKSGTRGDVISVRNIQSERVLKGVVEAENFVAVASPRAALPHSAEG